MGRLDDSALKGKQHKGKLRERFELDYAWKESKMCC